MGSELTDSWRAKYPGAYDNVPDDQLEKAIVAKFPGAYDHHVSDDTHVDNITVEPVESKVDEHPSKLSELWNKATKPTIDLIPRNITEHLDEPNSTDTVNQGRLKGFVRGSAEGLSDLISSFSSPLNIATAGMGGLEELTGSKLAQLGTKILSAPVVAHGAHDLLSSDSTLGQRFSGGVELAGGLLGLRSRTPEIAQRAMEHPTQPPNNNSSYLMKNNISSPNNAALAEDTIGKQIAAHRANELDKVRGSESDIPNNDVARRLELERTGNQPLSVDEVNKLFTNTKPLAEGTTIQFGRTDRPKINIDGPKVASLKPATPELIAKAQKTGPDVIHLKTADKIQLGNAAEYGYQFEGINSDGSLRLRKNVIDVPSNESPSNSGGNDGGGNEPPNDNNRQHLGPDLDKRKATIAQEVMNLPRGIMASWDLSAPFRQGLGLIHRPEWWKSWGSMFKSFGNEEAFRAVQDNIASKPLFKQFNGQPSFAEKAGLKLTDLTDLSSREEQIMSTWAEKIPGVRPSNRAYTAFLNKLRADTFESLMDSAKVINKSSGEIDMGLAKELANYINTSTGRGSLGSLEKYAPALNSIFFSPRLIASRLQMLNPVYYMTANPVVRKEAIKSLLSIAGAGQAITQLGKLVGGTVENDPVSSDFGKLKIGNTRIDPYGGFQQYIVAANRLLQGRTKSTVSSKETDLTEGKFGKQTRFDVAERFGESKLNPLIGLAITILRGKNLAGQKVDLPEEVASKFVPLFIQDLKTVATENPNLIPFYNELGLDKTSLGRGSLALPGGIGMGIQNYPSK